MARLLSADIWAQAAEQLKSRDLKVGAIAYVSLFSPIFKEGDILICDASEEAIECNQTKASILRKYFDNRVKIYSVENLHAKLIYTSTSLIIGSSNLSNNSAVNLIEAALLTNETSAIAQAEAFCHPFIDKKYQLTDEKLKKLESIKPIRQTRKYKGVPKERNRTFGGETWIISTKFSKNNKHDEEIEVTTQTVAKIHSVTIDEIQPIIWNLKGKFGNHAQIGNRVFQIHKENSRVRVYSESVLVRKDFRSDCILMYFKTPKSYNSISWTQFSTKVKSLILKRQIGKNSCRILTENEYKQLETILT